MSAADPQPPVIQGALITGAAAHALSAVLDRDEIATRLDARGMHEAYRERAMLAVEAIELEAERFRRTRAERLARTEVAQEVAHAQPRPMRPSQSTTMNTATAASTIGCSPAYVRRLAGGGHLAGHRNGRDWALDADSVHAYAAKRSGHAEEGNA